jgi:PTS system cellobiose-specific IIC component
MATLIFLMIQINIPNDFLIQLEESDIATLEQPKRDGLEKKLSITLDPDDRIDLEGKTLIHNTTQTLSMTGLSSAGLFTAILVALSTVPVQKFFTDANLIIRLPESVPRVVYESFASLSPLLFLMLVFWVIRFVIGVDINHTVQTALSPLVSALNTLPGILTYALMVTMLWSVGINGDNVMDAIVAPIFFQYLGANADAFLQGDPFPYITANGFFTTFVNVGGTGATIGLALVLWNSKEPGFRQVSRLSLPTQIFQINEPILFGIPIVLNPVFIIPYVLNALILTAATFLLMDWNVIQKPFVSVPWTTPPVIGHFLVTGGDWRAAVWGVASILIAMGVYYPFAKFAERERLKAQAQREAAKP